MKNLVNLADDGTTEVIGMFGLLGIAIVVIALTALFIAALVSILGSARYAAGGKALWVLASFVFPVLGPICWFIWGRSSSIENSPASGGAVNR